MQLNTKDLLSSNEETITSGITYHRIVTPSSWGDLTVNRSLYGYEVDRNFYNLKAQDIKSAYADGNSVFLEKWNGEKYEINVEKLSELAEELAKAEAQTEELSGATCDFIKKVEDEYCTVEKAEEIAKEAADEVRTEVEEAKYMTQSDLLTWLMNNLKTINCVSLIGKGNICIDCCGGCSSGSSFQLLSGDAIRIDVDKTDKSMEVNVVVESGTTETEESKHDNEKPGKNFLKIKKEGDKSWLQVDGVDADSIYITEDIKLGNTKLGEFAKEDSFPGGVIPQGMTLQAVLEKLFWKEQDETWDELVVSQVLKWVSNSTISVKAIDANGNDVTNKSVEVGSEVKFEITRIVGEGSQVSKVYPFSNGYKIGEESFTGTSFTIPNTIPSVAAGDITIETTGDMSPVEEKEYTYIVGVSASTFTASATDVLKKCPYSSITVYDISNMGNISEEHKAMLSDSASSLNDITISISSLCQINPYRPYYYGCYGTIEEITSEHVIEHFNKSTDGIKYTEDEATLEVIDGARQLLVAAPSSEITSMKIIDTMGFDNYDENDTVNININGADYLVWFYNSAVGQVSDSLKITFIK